MFKRFLFFIIFLESARRISLDFTPFEGGLTYCDLLSHLRLKLSPYTSGAETRSIPQST